MSLSIVIPTYGRDNVLCDTIRALIALETRADEILVVDQTLEHESATAERLAAWEAEGRIRWIRHQPPGTVGAMNRGVLEARRDIVLFLDDDIVPDDNLIRGHVKAYEKHPEAWAVVGQVIQPEDVGEKDNREFRGEPQKTQKDTEGETAGPILKSSESNLFHSPNSRFKYPLLCILRFLRLPFFSPSFLRQDLDFDFSGTDPAWVENVMAGNLSVRRERFLQLGGFDENFIPPVSYRFETEFAKRLIAAGGRIRFEPAASIRHLRVPSGGTRSRGSHLTSGSPIHGVGDYYFALRCGRGWQRLSYILRRPFREVCTRFHLRHPWWIPLKFVGELRAIWAALRLYRKGPKLLYDGKAKR